MNDRQQNAPAKLELHQMADADALRIALGSRDFSVPSRSERKTTHRENWTVSRFLSAAIRSKLLDFPLSLVPHEAPDFILRIGKRVVGVEIVEATLARFSEFMVHYERNESRSVIDIGHFRYGKKPAIYADANPWLSAAALTSMPWKSCEAEIEWTLFLRDTVRKKLNTLRKKHYTKTSENWLVIYDNLPLPNIDVFQSRILFKKYLDEEENNEPKFGKIFVVRSELVIELTQLEARPLPIENLWDTQIT